MDVNKIQHDLNPIKKSLYLYYIYIIFLITIVKFAYNYDR
jgi:hypothetical protein